MIFPKVPPDREGNLASKLKRMADRHKKKPNPVVVPTSSSSSKTPATTKKPRAAPRKKQPPKPVLGPDNGPDNFSLFSASERSVMKVMMSNQYLRTYFMHPSELVTFMEMTQGNYTALAEHAQKQPTPAEKTHQPASLVAAILPPPPPTAIITTSPFTCSLSQTRRVVSILRACLALSRARTALRKQKHK